MHPELAADLENLANVYYAAGRYDGAIAMLKQTLAIRRTMLADDNPAIGRTLYNIASTYRGKSDFAGAEPLFEEARGRLRRALGPNHPNVTLATGEAVPAVGQAEAVSAAVRRVMATA